MEIITIELCSLTYMTSRENHLRYTSSLVIAMSLSAFVVFAESSLITWW